MSTQIGKWVVEHQRDRTKETRAMAGGIHAHYRLALVYRHGGSRRTLLYFRLARAAVVIGHPRLGVHIPDYAPHDRWRYSVYRKIEQAGVHPCNAIMLQIELDKHRDGSEGVIRMRMEALAAQLNDLYTT